MRRTLAPPVQLGVSDPTFIDKYRLDSINRLTLPWAVSRYEALGRPIDPAITTPTPGGSQGKDGATSQFPGGVPISFAFATLAATSMGLAKNTFHLPAERDCIHLIPDRLTCAVSHHGP